MRSGAAWPRCWRRRRGEPLPTDAEQLARAIDAVTAGLLDLVMLDRRAVDETLCVATLAALAR